MRIASRVAIELRTAHGRLEPQERARLTELLRHSRGRLRRLSRGERSEVARLTLKAAGRGS